MSNKKQKPIGGGVLIYVKESYSYKIRNDLVDDDIECLWIEVKSPGIPAFLVGTFYRPPSAKKECNDKIRINIERAGLDNKQMYFTGDFNIDYNSTGSNLIKDIEDLYGVSQIVTSSTRVTPTSATCIDLILTTNPENHRVTEPFKIGLSDHYMVFTSLSLKIKGKNINHKYTTFRSYKNFNESAFINEVKKTFMNIHLHDCNMNDAWIKWKNKFLEISNKFAPIKRMRVKNRNNPWMDNEILEKMYERDYKHKKAVSTKDDTMWSQYKCLRNEVTTLIKRKKREYFITKLDSCKTSKEMWQVMNNIVPNTKNGNQIPPEMNADKFNKYFADIGLKLAKQHKDVTLPWKNPEYVRTFKFNSPTKKFVIKKLTRLPDRSNLDILGFDTILLKISARYICDSLCTLINKSFVTGIVPDDWKLARVTPVYKGDGDRLNESNYRPISVIGHIVKLAESEVKEQLLYYLLTNGLITSDQSAYLKNHSTTTCLHKVMYDWQEAINDGEIIGACFLDISKCFDSIDHNLLKIKLRKYGIAGTELDWFCSYLTGRKQVVRCNNIISESQAISIGVPQGSILGPILFLLFINDLTQFSGLSHCNLFADDALFYISNKNVLSVESQLQQALNNVSEWYKCNKLSLNVKKSNIMLIHRKKQINDRITINVSGTPLKQIDDVRYLGLYIDNKLQWNKHINVACKTITKKLGMMNRTSKYVNKKALVQIYKSFILPSFDYADTIWNGCSKFLEHKLQTLQNRAARIIEQDFDFINTRGLELIRKLNLQNTVQRREYRICTLMYKCVNSHVPYYLSDQIVMTRDIHDRCTRHANTKNIYIKQAKSDCLRRGFFIRGASLWNKLPDNMKESESLNTFKTRYMKYQTSNVST